MDKNSIELRIAPLTKDSVAKFGIMTPQHMLEHLALTVKISYGRIKIPDFEPTEKQLAQKQILIYSEIDFPKGIKAPGIGENLLDLRYADMETAKSELLKSIDQFNKHFNEFKDDLTIHPRFGKLNHGEWERFHRKHFHHHLGQFGI
jgi:oxepin-CoA hydrolase/3-oxo-5,6-dehydrosuberyl-CoA semialdehyde dehydrogenase